MYLYKRIRIIIVMGAIPKRCVVDNVVLEFLFKKSVLKKTVMLTTNENQWNIYNTLPFLNVFILYKSRFVHF